MATAARTIGPHDETALDRVRAIVLQQLAVRPVSVYLFGSWVRGTQHRSSDIDVAIDGGEPLPIGALARLRDALEESTVPYRVDVVDIAEAAPGFRERVRREGILWIGSATA